MNRFEFLLSWTIIPIIIVLGLFCQKIVSFAAQLSVNLHFMKVSTENDNNFGYEKITIVVDKISLKKKSKDWLAWNQDNMSEWGDVYLLALLISNKGCLSSTKWTSSSFY